MDEVWTLQGFSVDAPRTLFTDRNKGESCMQGPCSAAGAQDKNLQSTGVDCLPKMPLVTSACSL